MKLVVSAKNVNALIINGIFILLVQERCWSAVRRKNELVVCSLKDRSRTLQCAGVESHRPQDGLNVI